MFILLSLCIDGEKKDNIENTINDMIREHNHNHDHLIRWTMNL